VSRDDRRAGETSLAERLRAVPVPDEHAARERAQAVARAAFAQRAAAPPRRRLAPRALPAMAAAGAILLALLAFTPPGKAVSDWVRDAIGRKQAREAARPALDRLPAPGSLLVQSPEGPWVVRADGSKRLLGPYREATWSPFGRFVGVTRENGLLAVEPGGRVHWSLPRPRVSRPRWAPSGFRVAYRSGPDVRVVAGDGTGDRRLGRGVAAEWRPGTGQVTAVGGQKVLAGANVLAVARADGRVRALDVDSRRELWTSSHTSRARPRQLSWSGDGQRLLVVSPREVRVLDRFGGDAGQIALPAGAVATEAAFAPRDERVALVRRRRGVSELVLADGARERLLFAGAGRLSGVTWSPDGRWLLVAWPSADEFLFVRTRGPALVRTALRVANEFDPRAVGAAGDPLPVGWCCSTR
jgi:dipeptidyl aminopeptidase/acylaminoacyl peptidase